MEHAAEGAKMPDLLTRVQENADLALDLARRAALASPLPALPNGESQRAIREKAGLTRLQVGAALGVDPASIGLYEQKGVIPGGRVLLDYLRLLAVLSEDVEDSSSAPS